MEVKVKESFLEVTGRKEDNIPLSWGKAQHQRAQLGDGVQNQHRVRGPCP